MSRLPNEGPASGKHVEPSGDHVTASASHDASEGSEPDASGLEMTAGVWDSWQAKTPLMTTSKTYARFISILIRIDSNKTPGAGCQKTPRVVGVRHADTNVIAGPEQLATKDWHQHSAATCAILRVHSMVQEYVESTHWPPA